MAHESLLVQADQPPIHDEVHRADGYAHVPSDGIDAHWQDVVNGTVEAVAPRRYGRVWPYAVVRLRAGRPAAAAMPRNCSSLRAEPLLEPAIREIVSSIRVPPRSLQPR